jgi:hypothetical protein
MSGAWAKCPSAWARIKNRSGGDLDARQDDGSAYLPEEEGAIAHPSGEGLQPGLSHLRWRQHKGSGTAALMLLFALAIKSNLDQKTTRRRTGNQVVATYDDFQNDRDRFPKLRDHLNREFKELRRRCEELDEGVRSVLHLARPTLPPT